jgi:hypothetical protein
MRSWAVRRKIYLAIHRGLKPETLGVFDFEAMKIVGTDGSLPSALADLHTSRNHPEIPIPRVNEDFHLIDPNTVKHVGSYSWLSGEDTLTMMVPGESIYHSHARWLADSSQRHRVS